MFGVFRELNELTGVTIVIVTHDRAITQRVDRVVAMRDGRTSSEIVRNIQFSRGRGEVVEEFAVVDRSGRLQIPREYIEELRIGTRARVEIEGDHVEIRRENPDDEDRRPWGRR